MKFKVALVHLPDQKYRPSSHWPLLEDEIKMHNSLDLGTREVICGRRYIKASFGWRDPRFRRLRSLPKPRKPEWCDSHSVPPTQKSVRCAISFARRNNSSE